MNFTFIFLFLSFFILSACEDLSFNDEDIVLPETNSVQEISIIQGEDKKKFNINENSKHNPEEVTIISENLELSENTIIQNRKVILDMVTIQTLQHDLTIIADEFISNHSFIQSFPEGQTAKEKEIGKNGGHVLIKAKTAKGSLGLSLSGENGGYVPKRSISKKQRVRLSGRSGENGYDAIYDNYCRDLYIPTLFTGKLIISRNCWDECRVTPTKGQDGEDGRQGYPGYDGKKGGDSGSFHLQAFNLSDFHLTKIKKTPGLGSKGGRGSNGGYRGERGQHGRDKKDLCSSHLPRSKKGKKGKIGKDGIAGKNGKEGTVCLENIKIPESLETNNNQHEENKKESAICY